MTEPTKQGAEASPSTQAAARAELSTDDDHSAYWHDRGAQAGAALERQLGEADTRKAEAQRDAALAAAARLREALDDVYVSSHHLHVDVGALYPDGRCSYASCERAKDALAATPDAEKLLAEHHGDTGRESYAAVRGKAVAGSLHPASPHPKRHTRYGWDALLAQTLAIRPIIDAEIARRDRIAAGDKTAGSMPPAEWDALASLPATANLPARYLDLDSPEAERRLAAALATVGGVGRPQPNGAARAILAALRAEPVVPPAGRQPAEPVE